MLSFLRPFIVQAVSHFRLIIGKQVGIPVGDVDALVAYTFSNCHGGESHFDEKRNVGVPQIVNPNAFDACLFCAPVHLVMQIVLGDGEDAIR